MEKQNPRGQGAGPREAEVKPLQGFDVKNALLSPGPSPRGPPRRTRATQLHPPGDKGSRGDGRAPKSSPRPAHPGQRHVHAEGGVVSGSECTPQCARADPQCCRAPRARAWKGEKDPIGRGAASAGRTGSGPTSGGSVCESEDAFSLRGPVLSSAP